VPAPALAADPAPTATAAQQLPYTGADAGIVLAGGVVLLAGGVALRLRVR
jgi:LPXTG-motif cell wall-anchored protein